MMGNAYQCREEYSSDGKRLVKRERTVGSVVIWGIVALAAILTGYAFIPSTFWTLLKF
jgi:hypothetical protein